MKNVMEKTIRDVRPGPVVERWLEEIEVGERHEAGPITVTAEEIISFAERYDPLPMHTSDSGGGAAGHGSMISSGVLTVALKQRLIMSIERNAALIGAARIEEQNFVRPVCAGDELSLRQECIAKRESRTRPDRGLVAYRFEVVNQKGEVVLDSVDHVMVRRRPRD